MENYIVINGKKAELTEEQLKALGIETEKKNPFARCQDEEKYYYIEYDGEVLQDTEYNSETDIKCYKVANYCTDKNLLQQRAWHETLNRLLWRYSMEHDGDKIKWNDDQWKYIIYYDRGCCTFKIDMYRTFNYDSIWFYTRGIAENAIKEIIEPFMKEHPGFVW